MRGRKGRGDSEVGVSTETCEKGVQKGRGKEGGGQKARIGVGRGGRIKANSSSSSSNNSRAYTLNKDAHQDQQQPILIGG
jgi:hypothetical protein